MPVSAIEEQKLRRRLRTGADGGGPEDPAPCQWHGDRGDWEPVSAAIQACHQAVHAMGCQGVFTTVHVNTRTDREQTLEEEVASVQALL